MNKKPAIIVAHIIIILLAYSSPFWLDWRLVLVGVAANYIQLIVFGGCVLSYAQFEDKQQTFHEWYLRKLGLHPSRKILTFILRWVIPFILLGLALMYQVMLHGNMLIKF